MFYNDYEELGLTVVKKINKRKIVLLVAVLILLIVFMIYLISIHLKMKKIKEEQIELQRIEEINKEEEERKRIEEEKKEAEKIIIPQLTDEGRNRISNIYKSDEKVVYLTFDDGPSPNITPQILETLNKYNIKATFFLLGQNVEKYPDLVKQEYKSGHYIANHGYTHTYSKIYASGQAVLDEYTRTEESIRNALGIENFSTHLFRFPGGSMGTKYASVKNDAKNLIYQNDAVYIDWNALNNDSVGKPTEESLINDVKETVGEKNSVVILMHDAAAKQITANTLGTVIDYLIEKGYTFKNFYDIIV